MSRIYFLTCLGLLLAAGCARVSMVSGDAGQVEPATLPEYVPACDVDLPCGATVPPDTGVVMTLQPVVSKPAENPYPDCSARSDAIIEARLLELVNAARNAENLPALVTETRLTAAARSHALDVACHDSVSHFGTDGSSLEDRLIAQGYAYHFFAENIYAGGAGTPEAAIQAMLNSPEHKANLLSPKFLEVGIAYIILDDSVYHDYYVIDFAAPAP